jgi:predicted nucleic acid-binding protein
MAPHPVILVDSDILIAHLRGLEAARDWLLNARSEGPLAISVVSIAELVGGMRSAERREAWRLLASFRAEPATEIIARQAGEFRRQYRRSHSGIGLGDYLIAATAEVKGYRLGTLNVKHFPMFQGLWPPFAIS